MYLSRCQGFFDITQPTTKLNDGQWMGVSVDRYSFWISKCLRIAYFNLGRIQGVARQPTFLGFENIAEIGIENSKYKRKNESEWDSFWKTTTKSAFMWNEIFSVVLDLFRYPIGIKNSHAPICNVLDPSILMLNIDPKLDRLSVSN